MSALLAHLRAEARRRWPAWVAVVLLIGALGGIVLGTVAGARRTSTVYDRLAEAAEVWDVLVNPNEGAFSALDIDDVRALPQVTELGVVEGVGAALVGPEGELLEDPLVLAQADTDVLVEFARPHVLDGRLLDPNDPLSITISRDLAEQYGFAAGDQVQVAVASTEDLIAWEEAGAQGPPPFEPRAARIDGITISHDDIVVDEGFDFATVYLSKAFADEHGLEPFFYGMAIRLQNGQADVPQLRESVQALVPDEEFEFQTAAITEEVVDRGTRPNIIALLALAAVVGLAGTVVAAQALATQLSSLRTDAASLAAIGLDRSQVRRAGTLRMLLMAAAGTVTAVVIAIGLSPIFPVGAVRPAEIEPGIDVDPVVLAPGSVVLFAGLLVASVLAVRRLGAAADRERDQVDLTDRIATVAPNPVVTAGLRAALASGSRQPIGSWGAAAGLGVAVAAVAAALTFGAGLNRLVTHPVDYGWNWQVLIDLDIDDEGAPERYAAAASNVAGLSGYSRLSVDQVPVAGHRIPAVGIDYQIGDVGPTIVAGARPELANEVALGARTMRLLDVGIGDTIVAGPDASSRELTVVGQAVFAGLGTYPGADRTELGKGMLLPFDTIGGVGEGFAAGFQSLVLSAPDRVSLDGVIDDLLSQADPSGEPGAYVQHIPQRPADIRSLERVRATPAVVAGVLALLAGAALALVLLSGVRARRRELALLKTLGFDRRQLGATVAWQATATALIALLVGVPLGILLGRGAWGLLTTNLGVADHATLPASLALVVIGVLVVANLVALVPARIAATTRAGITLRTE